MNTRVVDSKSINWEKARQRIIPCLEPLTDLDAIFLNLTDPRSSEKLVEVRTLGIAGNNYYHGTNNPPYYHSAPGSIPNLLVRETVANKLISINQRLNNIGLELYLFDAYRPVAVQNHFFFTWMPAYLLSQFPEKGEEWARKETARFWSPGSHDLSVLTLRPPLHSTGGAVDLTLRSMGGQLLEMGTIFDDLVDRAAPDFFERNGSFSFTDREAMLNRRILFHSMIDEGFVPHPLEWWHFSFGDRLWASINNTESIYGYLSSI